ncbi:hypothetical protein NL449_28790, partial [Klebsiella pneumoniae]|nr:hypothetical protein [Klebsiella pneumoniae]
LVPRPLYGSVCCQHFLILDFVALFVGSTDGKLEGMDGITVIAKIGWLLHLAELQQWSDCYTWRWLLVDGGQISVPNTSLSRI